MQAGRTTGLHAALARQTRSAVTSRTAVGVVDADEITHRAAALVAQRIHREVGREQRGDLVWLTIEIHALDFHLVAVKSQRVGITIDSIEVNGAEAVVRATKSKVGKPLQLMAR